MKCCKLFKHEHLRTVTNICSQSDEYLNLNLLKFLLAISYIDSPDFQFLIHLYVVVTTTSSKPSGGISGLDLNCSL